MQEYKYTYQDWEKGEIHHHDLFDLFIDKEISQRDLNLIEAVQDKAFKLFIKNKLLEKVHNFLLYYNYSIPKAKYIDTEISFLQKKVDEFIVGNPEAYKDAMLGLDGRQDLTYGDIKLINDNSPEFDYAENTAPGLIINLEYLQWLKWYQSKEAVARDTVFEQYLYQASQQGEKVYRDARIERYKARYLTWPNLFKDPNQADNILSLIEEHLSSTGQWLTEPKGRYLVALCSELQSKGYLKSHSAPVLAAAFNNQFDVQLSSKNYQPQKSKEAEDKREYFRNIPHYQQK